MLLGYSSAFFDVEANLTELTAVLGGTCNTPQTADQCVGVMGWMTDTIKDVCSTDIGEKNALALEALNGEFGRCDDIRPITDFNKQDSHPIRLCVRQDA